MKELSNEEMQNVNGGIAPFVIAYYGTLACMAGWAAITGAYIGYKANRDHK